MQLKTAVDLLTDETEEPRGASPKPANSSLRKPSKRRPLACGTSLVISTSSVASSCAFVALKVDEAYGGGSAAFGEPKLLRKLGSSNSGILNCTPGRRLFNRSISSRLRGLPFPRR
jgi:hypothetical protein